MKIRLYYPGGEKSDIICKEIFHMNENQNRREQKQQNQNQNQREQKQQNQQEQNRREEQLNRR